MNGGRRFRAMQVRNVLDPFVDVLRVLALAAFDLLHGRGLLGRLLRNGPQLKVKDWRVALLGSGLVQDCQAKGFLGRSRTILLRVQNSNTTIVNLKNQNRKYEKAWDTSYKFKLNCHLFTVWPTDFDERVNVSDRRNVIRDERLEPRLEVDRLRRVANDVVEQLLHVGL